VNSEPGAIRRYQFWMGIVFAVACAVYLVVVTVLNIDTEAAEVHYYSWDRASDRTWVFEYPPLSLLVMALPRLFTADPFLYNVGFVAEMFVFFIIGLFVICKLAERLGRDQKKFMLAYTIFMMLMLEFVIDRYDIIPAVIALAAVYCFITKRYTWAFVLLAIGTMVKLYPAVLFPIFMIPLIVDRDWKNALKGAGAFAAAAFAVLVPILILHPDMLYDFIGYHADRPLQIESLAASLLYPFEMLGLISGVEFGFGSGSDNMLGPLPDAVAQFLMPLMVVAVLAVCGL
jgi:Gpi18-like mannosyltransferase